MCNVIEKFARSPPQRGSTGYLRCPRLGAAGHCEVLPRPGEGRHTHRLQGVPGAAQYSTVQYQMHSGLHAQYHSVHSHGR